MKASRSCGLFDAQLQAAVLLYIPEDEQIIGIVNDRIMQSFATSGRLTIGQSKLKFCTVGCAAAALQGVLLVPDQRAVEGLWPGVWDLVYPRTWLSARADTSH